MNIAAAGRQRSTNADPDAQAESTITRQKFLTSKKKHRSRR
jgi:hypothetical protein